MFILEGVVGSLFIMALTLSAGLNHTTASPISQLRVHIATQ